MPDLPKSVTLKFYKRKEIQEAIVAHAKRKEIGMCYGEGYGKRPDVLVYPRDILELALQGVTSFHASEELWTNPLGIRNDLSRQELDHLRVGWDLVLDIDCKVMEYSRIAADLIIKFLEYCGVQDISCKFSGNKGFHIGVPFEAFPSTVGDKNTKDLFPDAARKIALYIRENIKEALGRQILEFEQGSIVAVREKVDLEAEKLIRYETSPFGDKIAKLNADNFLEIDTVLIASRHLYRMPYSLHEKSGLVSLPLDPKKVLEFTKPMARPEVVEPVFTFLDKGTVKEQSARRLLLQALDFEVSFSSQDERQGTARKYEEVTITRPITEEFFPPCIKAMSQGLEDGKKRAVFCLMNYLGKIGWNKQEIEAYLVQWNKEKNRVPLREVYIKGQMAHFTPGEKLPPNCDNDAYYASLGVVCRPDDHCKRFKNPVNYTLSKWKRHMHFKAEEEEKEMRSRRRKNVKNEKGVAPFQQDTL